MMTEPEVPTIARAWTMNEESFAIRKAHKAMNKHNKVLMLTNTMWKPLRDMTKLEVSGLSRKIYQRSDRLEREP